MLRRTPSPTQSPENLRERLLELTWSLWTEMGVPGWIRRHQGWTIDPEALILFTALVGESDPRLREECIRWCVRNGRYIASARLRNLLKTASPGLRVRWGPFAATVNALGGTGWPGATEPLPVRPSSKEGLDDFTRPALINLRLRTTFGLGARSEILLYFVARPEARATASDLSEVVHYTKRNVEKELEALRKAGMLGVERRRNRLEHFVAQPESLLMIAAPRPDYFPSWDALFVVLGAVLEYEKQVSEMSPAVAAVEARRLLRDISSAVRQSGLPTPPTEVPDHTLVASLLHWASGAIEALARADASALGWTAVKPISARDRRTTHADGVRSVVSPLLATATDLAVWADTRAAQERMPELLRRLILATADDLERIDMAAGEGIQRGGYDGVVETGSATPFVPVGRSVWEIGANSDVKGKADDDFEKRSANPGTVVPSAATFVFVTPRRWASKRLWEEQQRQKGPWRDVRVLDADDLEAWLGLAPAVHAWLSALLGKNWESIHDLRSHWSDWCEATDPPLSADVVLAGRATAADDLRKRLRESSVLVRVRGESADEALAFIAATMHGMDQADALLARSLVVNDIAGWNWATNSAGPLFLIPRFTDPNTTHAIRQGHRILIPVGREEGSQDDLILPRLRRDAVKSVLLSAGVPQGVADDLAARGRASLTSLRRRLALDKGLERPDWAHRVEAPALLPALLAGAWDDTKPGDQEVISCLAERPYQEVERSMVRWARASDPPVRKVGTNWFLVSKEDAWHILSPHLTPHDLERFREALLRALGVHDPSLDLPLEKRFMANVLGHEHPISEYLREGLVDTLAIMGARSGEAVLLTGHTGQWHADIITRDLLDRANADDSGKLWASLSGVLPLLAEAAPEPFLRAVEVALTRDPSPLLTLFADADPTGAFFASSPHTGLLWALENLAWSPEYLSLVAQYLAILSRLDPGGKLANRPHASLRSIFLIWDPQTAAPLPFRLDVLDTLRRREPNVAWQLMMSISPKRHDISMPSYAPRWRDWKDPRDERVPFEDYDEAVAAVTDRLLADVGVDGRRWGDLIRAIADLPWQRVVEAIERTPPETFIDEDRTLVWTALRSKISKHRSFPDAEWALPGDVVDRLEQIYERFTPSDPVQRSAWLFTQRPDLLEGERTDWARQRRIVQDAQTNAIRSLRERGGVAALLRLAAAAKEPEQVGYVIGQTTSPAMTGEQRALFDLIGAPKKIAGMVARGYVAGRFEVGGWEWSRAVLEKTVSTWSPERRAAFLLGLPFDPRTWDWAERFGQDTERAYWSGVPMPWISDAAAAERAAERLIRYGRADRAVDLLGMLLHTPKPPIDPELVAQALEELLRQGSPQQLAGLAHDVSTLLDYLEKSEAVEAPRLARLEWGYLALLGRGGRHAGVLHTELARNPKFFVDVLCMVFRAHDEDPQEVSSETRTNAMLGYRLLDSWQRPPGRRDDGTIDEELLNAWVDEARALAMEQRRQRIADQQIGRVLRYIPDDPSGLWPNRLVRDLVERIGSLHIETGLEFGLHTSRGVTWRSPTDGGEQERVLQAQYSGYAQQVVAQWPRTAAMLRRIARSYAEQARRHDEEAEITEDRWR